MPMKLMNADLSPYTTRNRIQIRAKGLENEIAIVPRMELDAYKLIAPTGRIPCLDTGTGFFLVESETIAEYIEDMFPEPSLRGRDPLARAKVRLFARLLDMYFLPGLNTLFGQFGANPRDPAKVDDGLAKLDEGLRHVEHYLHDDETYAVEERLTLADCALVPALFYANITPGVFSKEPFLGHAKALRYYERVTAKDAHLKRAVDEMGVSLQQFLAARAA
ncbi:MAG: glutathione S-transferase family protein [Pseudomonadota bacterium]